MTEHPSTGGAGSTVSLLSRAVGLAGGLVRKEIDLVRAEVSEAANKAAVAVGLILGGLVLVLVALNVLTGSLVAGLARLMAGEMADEATLAAMTGWAALIVGVIYFIVAVILVRKGTNNLKAASLAPSRAAQSVRKDVNVLKEKIHG